MISAEEGEKLSLLNILEHNCRNSANVSALVVHGAHNAATATTTRSLSYSNVWVSIEKHRLWLQKRITELSPGEHSVGDDVVISYLSSNSADFLLSLMASTSRFVDSQNQNTYNVAALLNVRWTPTEMAEALESKNAHRSKTIIMYGDGFAETAADVSRKLGHLSVCFPIPKFSMKLLKHLEDSPKHGASSSPVPSKCFTIDELDRLGDERDAMIVFTSGTTGGSKGVRLSHRAIAIQSIAKISDPCYYSSDTAMLGSTVPFFHVGGISSTLAVLFGGGSLVFPFSSKAMFDPQSVKATIENPILPTNTLVVVPAMLVALVAEIESSVYPNVRLILIGGQSVSKTIVDKLERRFPNAEIVQTYACTEAASSLTFLRVTRNDANTRQGRAILSQVLTIGDCVGLPPRHVQLRLYERESKATKIVTMPNQVGIIATRGPHVMNGYWSRGSLGPQQTTGVSGWFLTNDLGFFDEENRLHFCGRIRDEIRSGGETIHALEVERVLLQNPDIEECAVFALPDDRFGQAVACAIVAKVGLKLDGIKDWCQKQGLASYKRPRYVFLVDSLPRNASGKVLKHKLVETFGKTQSKL